MGLPQPRRNRLITHSFQIHSTIPGQGHASAARDRPSDYADYASNANTIEDYSLIRTYNEEPSGVGDDRPVAGDIRRSSDDSAGECFRDGARLYSMPKAYRRSDIEMGKTSLHPSDQASRRSLTKEELAEELANAVPHRSFAGRGERRREINSRDPLS